MGGGGILAGRTSPCGRVCSKWEGARQTMHHETAR